MLRHWKLSKGVVKLLPRLHAKVNERSGELHYKSIPHTASWAVVIAEKNNKYLCLYGPHRKWLDKEKVRLL